MKTRKSKFSRALAVAMAAVLLMPAGGTVAAAKPALNKKKVTLRAGSTAKLRVKNNRKRVKWSSSKRKVASVSRRGLVRAKKAGSARITAKVGGKRYVCKVTVKNRPIPTAAATKPPETAKPTYAPPTYAPPAYAPTTYAGEVLRLVNVERAQRGLSPLVLDQKLCEAADKRAQELISVFSHTRPDGTDCFTVFQEYGIKYRTAAENIAYGQSTPEQVVAGWMNSPGHRANILGPGFGKLGVGIVMTNDAYQYYWVQLFTN